MPNIWLLMIADIKLMTLLKTSCGFPLERLHFKLHRGSIHLPRPIRRLVS